MTTVLSGCRDSVNPSSTILEIGTYSYTYSSPRPFGGDDLYFPGQLVLTYATEDSIAGHWQVAEYQATAGGGFWDVDAYYLTAQPGGQAWTIEHRIKRSGAELIVDCGVLYFQNYPDGPTRLPGTCTLSN